MYAMDSFLYDMSKLVMIDIIFLSRSCLNIRWLRELGAYRRRQAPM
jgi:hypothetical protein